MDRAKQLTREYFLKYDKAYADVFSFVLWRQKLDLVVDPMDLCPIGDSRIADVDSGECVYETEEERELIKLWRREDGTETLLVLRLEADYDYEYRPKIVLFGGKEPAAGKKRVLSGITSGGRLIPVVSATLQLTEDYPLSWVEGDACMVDPRVIDDADFQHFKTDLSQVLHVLKYRDSEQYPGPGKFVYVCDDALFMLFAYGYPAFHYAKRNRPKTVNLLEAFQLAQDQACAACIAAARENLRLTYREALAAFGIPEEQWSVFRNRMKHAEAERDEERDEPAEGMKGMLRKAIIVCVRSAMKNLSLSLEEVLAACDVPKDEWDAYRELQKKAETERSKAEENDAANAEPASEGKAE